MALMFFIASCVQYFASKNKQNFSNIPCVPVLKTKRYANSAIQLLETHWEVIRYVCHYHLERGFVCRSRELSSAPNARFREQGGKKSLYRLFKGGPVLKACPLGGVPLPENCIDPSFGTTF
ncbi:MAG: TusE/DsrC/DsvC family sulfur relay protein [Thiogranum sp.]